MITLALTSCNRLDLLDETIRSFLEHDTSGLISRRIISEDSGCPEVIDAVSQKYPEFEVLGPIPRVGQTAIIDQMYSLIETPYIFHCEDDWRFVRSGFIEKSLVILETNKQVLQVHIRGAADMNGHPIEPMVYDQDSVNYRLLSLNYLRNPGFSWNPGLRRLCDYKSLGSYSRYPAEHLIGRAYWRRRPAVPCRAAILLDSYVEHIGGGRRVHRIAK